MDKGCQNVESGAVYQSPAWSRIKLAVHLLCLAGTVTVVTLGTQIAVENIRSTGIGLSSSSISALW